MRNQRCSFKQCTKWTYRDSGFCIWHRSMLRDRYHYKPDLVHSNPLPPATTPSLRTRTGEYSVTGIWSQTEWDNYINNILHHIDIVAPGEEQ